MSRKRAKHPHLLHAALLTGGVALLVVIALLIKAGGPAQTAAVIQSDIIALTNSERIQNDLGTLQESALLDQAAQAKANDMATKGYFSHTGPDGQPPWHWFVEAGYDYHFAGENLAVRFSDSSEVVNAWMASPTHRANIVKSQYTQIGIGIADGMYQGQPATFVVQFFGAPQTATAPSERVQPVVAVTKSAATPLPTAPTATNPTIAGTETSVPETQTPTIQINVSVFDRIAGFFAFAWRSLTANAADSGGVVIDIGASTER